MLRGLKTLALRMQRHCENARAVAEFLEGIPRSSTCSTRGSAAIPATSVAARQMSGFGGMVSFLASSAEEAIALVARTKIWKLAESLGGVESLIEVPAAMTHASTADAPFAAPPNLVRLSVGIESVDDLVADLEAALFARRDGLTRLATRRPEPDSRAEGYAPVSETGLKRLSDSSSTGCAASARIRPWPAPT